MLIMKKAIEYKINVSLRTPSDIGAYIRASRKSLNLGQAELAARVGVSRLWISQVERGKAGASLGLVLQTLAELRVELSGASAGGEVAEGETYPAVFTPDINKIIADLRANSNNE